MSASALALFMNDAQYNEVRPCAPLTPRSAGRHHHPLSHAPAQTVLAMRSIFRPLGIARGHEWSDITEHGFAHARRVMDVRS